MIGRPDPQLHAAPREGDEELLKHKAYLNELFELAPDAIVLTTLPNPRILHINREFSRTFGYTAEEAVGSPLRELVMPNVAEAVLPDDPDLLAGKKVEWEVTRRRKDGTEFHAHVTGKRIRLSSNEDAAYLIFRDISARKQAEALLAGQRQLLEVVAAGSSLSTILDALCRLVEDVDRGARVSILLLDRQGKHLRHGAGPSLPQAYRAAIDGASVGLGIGPCAAAAHLREQVISVDLVADPRWSDEMRAVASAHGLRACWSTPIKSSTGRVLGTFAIYPDQLTGPTPEENSRIEQFTHLASIAIERAQSMDALRQSEERYALAMEAAADGHTDWNLVTGEFYISPRLLSIIGHAPDATFADRADWVRRFPFHPEDRLRWNAAVAAHFAGREAKFRGDYRIVVKGETRWLAFNFIATRDTAGNVVRWTGSIADINDAQRDIATVLDAIPGLVAILTSAGEVDVVNRELVDYCGQPVEAMRQWGTNGTVHDEDLPVVSNVFTRALAAGEPYEFEARIRHFDGAYRWNQIRGLPSRDRDGRIVRWYVLLSDIDARKRAEEGLRLSEERYALAVAGSDDGVWDVDFVAESIFVSNRARELAGMPPGPEITSMEEWFSGLPLHPEDVPRRIAAMQAHLTGQTAAYEGEFRLRQPDGIYRWRRLHGLCLRNADGEPRRMAGSISDVDTRHRAEDALRLSEERYALALEASEEGHFDIDLQADEIFVSARVNEIYGFPPQARTMSRAEFLNLIPFHPDDRPGVLAEVSKHDWNDRNLQEIQCRIVPRPGETRWIRSRAKVVRDAHGCPRRRVGVLADITERKRAEEALREQTERLQLGQAAMRMIIMDWNIAEDVITWSGSPEWLRGPMPTSGGYPLFKHQVHPEDRDGFLATRRSALETLQVQTTEFRLVRTDGEVIWVLERKHAFAGVDGKPVRMLAAMFDITDRKRAEEALRESRERYALAVAGSHDGIWDWDMVSDTMFVSDRAQRIFGLDPGQTERPREEWHAMIAFHPEDHEAQRRMVEDYLSGALPYNEGEWRIRERDGSYRWIRIRSICLRDSAGRPVRMAGSVSDVDAQKKAEAALRVSEERYALAMDVSEEGHFDWNVQTHDFFASEHLRRLLGLPGELNRVRSELIPSRIPVHPDDRPWIVEMARQVVAGTALQHEFEYRVLRGREAEVRWIHSRWKIFRDAQGTAQRVIGVISDITERKTAADDLRESEARFRALTALWSDWYWRQDESLRFSYSTAAIDPPDGYPGGSSIGKARWELPGIVPLSSGWAEHRQVLAARKPFRDFEYSRPATDGTLRYISTSGTPIFDASGAFRGYHGVGRDITERRRVEEALRSRQEMLEVAQKAARAAAFEWRVGGGPNSWSPDLEAMHGIRVGSYDGTYESWRNLVHADDWPNVETALKDALQTGDVDAEYRVLHSNGDVRWLQAKGRVFSDAEGKPVRIVGFVLDVTDRHRTEEELQRIEQQLRQAQRLEALGTLAGGIAHDFNNLLGAILGYGEMALRNVRAGSRLRRDIENIVIAGERGHALVERILAFSRSGVAEQVAVHVEKVVRETLTLFAAKLSPQIVIERNLHAGTAAVMGDPTQIHQVLMNLLSNATQAMPSGGIVRVSLEQRRVETSRVVTTGLIAAGDHVVLHVADSGTGIPPHVLDRIFDPFFTTKEVGVGTGLGLSLVHGIVSGLGGAIDVATTVGKGSTFTVYLPRAADAALPVDARKRSPRRTRRAGRGHVMVIDDEEALVRLVTATLTDLGYSTVGYTSSAKAIEAFLAGPDEFDAVITDESMPGASGSDLIRKMRAHRPTLPIVLVSGYLSGPVIERAREAGATELLTKPLRARALAAILERALGKGETAGRKNDTAATKATRKRSR